MKKLIIPVAAMLLFASCKKDSTCDISASTIVGTYKVTAATYQASSSSAVEDDFVYYDDCEKDDTFTFASGGAVTITDAGTTCSPSDNDSDTWSLSGNQLTFGSGETVDVSNFTCTGMVLRSVDDITGEIYTVTYAKQ